MVEPGPPHGTAPPQGGHDLLVLAASEWAKEYAQTREEAGVAR